RYRLAVDHDVAVARQVDVVILEIVLPRAAYPDLLLQEVRASGWVPMTLAWEGARWEKNKPAAPDRAFRMAAVAVPGIVSRVGMAVGDRAVNPVLEEILQSNQVRDEHGVCRPLRAQMSEAEG